MTALNPYIGVGIDEFIQKNKRLIHKICHRFTQRLKRTSMDYDDLFDIAAIGFTKAYQRFNPEAFINPATGNGVKFSTYAMPMMSGEIQRYFRDDDPGLSYSRNIKELVWKILAQELQDLPSIEIYDRLGKIPYNQNRDVQMEDIHNALHYIWNGIPASSDETVFDDDGDQPITLGETIHMASWTDYSSVYVEDFLSTLKPRMRKVVELTMADKKQATIGEILGVSQVQVSRLLKKVGELYIEHLEGKNQKPKLTSIEKLMEDMTAREVAVSTDEEVVTVTKGDLNTTKKLLSETTLGYREIAKITGCTLNVISDLAKQHRPAEVRKAANPFIKDEEENDELLVIDINDTELRLKNKKELEAVNLLKETRKSYGEIAKESGVSYGRIGYFGPKFRSEELRRELQIEHGKKQSSTISELPTKPGIISTGNRDKAVELLAKGGYTFKDIWRMTGVPMGSLTKLKRDYEAGKYEWENKPAKTVAIKKDLPVETPVINLPEFMGELDKKAKEEEVVNEPTFKAAVEPEVKLVPMIENAIKHYEEEKKAEQPAIAEFEVTPKAPRKIRRKMTVEADGDDVTAAEALSEVEEIYNLLKNMNGDKVVSFAVKVHA